MSKISIDKAAMNEMAMNNLEGLIIKIIVVAGIVVVSVVACKIIGMAIKMALKASLKKRPDSERKLMTLSSVTYGIVRYAVYFIGLFTILKVLGVPVESLLAVAGIGSVAIGFGAQSLVKDVITGFFILLEDQYGVGDIVEIEGKSGVIEGMSLRTTLLRGFDGTLHIIPNGNIATVSNMCKEYMNAIVEIELSYKDDAEKLMGIIKDELRNSKGDIKGLRAEPNVLGIVDMSGSLVKVRIVAECEIKENYAAERTIRLLIKRRLQKEGISQPLAESVIKVVGHN